MWPFLCSDRVPLCPLSGELLSQMDIGLFLKLSLHLLRSMDLWILINSCITWMNPTWSCCVVLLMSCWIWFATVWLRILCLCSSLILPCNFLFWWHICLLVVSGWWWPHRMSLRSVLSSASFWNGFRRILIDCSLNAWRNLPVKFWYWPSVFWKILNQSFNFSTYDVFLCIFYFSLVHTWKIVPLYMKVRKQQLEMEMEQETFSK